MHSIIIGRLRDVAVASIRVSLTDGVSSKHQNIWEIRATDCPEVHAAPAVFGSDENIFCDERVLY
jgi:hypothetical protein